MRYNKNEWNPWVELVNKGSVKSTIDQVPKKYKPLVAAALSVAKWAKKITFEEGISTSLCGLCCLYNGGWCYSYHEKNCLLTKAGEACYAKGSKYYIWNDNNTFYSRAKYEPSMHRMLLRVYEAEYKKVIG